MGSGFAKSINGKLQVELAYELFNSIIIFIQTSIELKWRIQKSCEFL